MIFGDVPLTQAKGAILAHSQTLPAGRLAKGMVLEANHITQLQAAGIETVTVARLDADDMGENAAASMCG
jgi:molybdenum cofactor cytidylyltransferase